MEHVGVLTAHAFRSARRADAMKRKEAITLGLRLKLASVEAELSSWRNWFDGMQKNPAMLPESDGPPAVDKRVLPNYMRSVCTQNEAYEVETKDAAAQVDLETHHIGVQTEDDSCMEDWKEKTSSSPGKGEMKCKVFDPPIFGTQSTTSIFDMSISSSLASPTGGLFAFGAAAASTSSFPTTSAPGRTIL